MSSELPSLNLSAEEWEVIFVSCAGLDLANRRNIRDCLVDAVNSGLQEDFFRLTNGGRVVIEASARSAGATLIQKLQEASEEQLNDLTQRIPGIGTAPAS